jgi:hypothetical protein
LQSGCITRVRDDACVKLFEAAKSPDGVTPGDTLAAAEAIARHPWQQPDKLFLLLDRFYPLAPGARLRKAPFIPYFELPPGDWTLLLTYAGGGLKSLGGIAIDAEGNVWAADNFLVRSQSTLYQNIRGGLSNSQGHRRDDAGLGGAAAKFRGAYFQRALSVARGQHAKS